MRNTYRPLIVVLAIVMIFVSVGIPVGAQGGIRDGSTSQVENQTLQDDGTNAVVPGGPGFIMIHPTSFIPMYSIWEYAFSSGGGYLYNPVSTTDIYYYEAAVNLPHGAKITKVVVYYYDNSTENLWMVLAAINMDDGNLPNLSYLQSSGAENSYRVMEDTTIEPDIIDNQSYAYWIEVGIPGNQGTYLALRGVRIDYSYPVSLPLIKR